jgi:uncharacterized protein
MNRDFLSMLNNAGIAQNMTQLQQALLLLATRAVSQDEELKKDSRQMDSLLLDNAGPAAASAAVEYATNQCKIAGILKDSSLSRMNGSFVNNMRIIQNDLPGDAYDPYSSSLRQFLLPRSAYYSFDALVDPRHNVEAECGYPRWITPMMYRYMYDRDDVAHRVVDIYPNESWATDPQVYEDEDEENVTQFETAWNDLCEDYQVMQHLYRLDRLSGIGHYGVLLLGLDDTSDFSQPVQEAELLSGNPRAVASKRRNLLYLRPFDEYLSFIQKYDTDPSSPRYGMPEYYNLVFVDMTTNSGGSSVGTHMNRTVHWTRVIHLADNLESSGVFGAPRQRTVFHRLLDLRKVKGGSGEMFWKGAWPGISFEVDPRFIADQPEWDKEEFRKEIRNYAEGFDRYLALLGVTAKSLAPQIADPEKHVRVQMEAIAVALSMPTRVFMGSEEGKLASAQDSVTWNSRLKVRIRNHVDPFIIRRSVNHLIAVGVLPNPASGRYQVGREDLNTSTDEDKANLSLKWTQALSQYVATGMVHLIEPIDYLTVVLGFTPAQALRIVKKLASSGGLSKLKSVDPSQGAGVNGKRENIADKGDSGNARSRPVERDTADKKAEGMSS